MPLANAFCHFRVKVAFVVKKVESLIHINNNVEEQLDTSARCERCRDHRHAKEFAELCIVDIVAAFSVSSNMFKAHTMRRCISMSCVVR